MSWSDLNHAVLPIAELLPTWVKLSWCIVLSAMVLRLSRFNKAGIWSAAAVAASMWLPPADLLSGYLALVFQTPSLVLVVWGLGSWSDVVKPRECSTTAPISMALIGVLLGWGLVIDELNAWPTFFNPQLYAFGFESSALWFVLAIAAAMLCLSHVSMRWVISTMFLLIVYVLLRLPTGNVWDALLDPFVWLALHVQLWRTWRSART